MFQKSLKVLKRQHKETSSFQKEFDCVPWNLCCHNYPFISFFESLNTLELKLSPTGFPVTRITVKIGLINHFGCVNY